MKVSLPLILVVLVGCSSSRTYLGQKVVDAPFVVAGGTRTLMLPVTDGGPIPAEDERIKIEAAGFVISKANPTPTISWIFAFTSKRPQVIERVVVEELSANEPLVVVRDDSPTLRDNYWSQHSETMDAGPRSQPWLYSSDTSIFVFKFTIECSNDSPMVYYQPAWFPGVAKAAMLRAPSGGSARK